VGLTFRITNLDNNQNNTRNKSQSYFISFNFRQGGRAGVKAARAAALQCEAVHAGVCASAHVSVWECTRQCVAVRLVVYWQCKALGSALESVRGSVRLCGSEAVCCSAAVCGCAARRARVCGSAVVCSSAAVCGSAHGSVRQCVAVCGSVCGIVWWQCALREHIHKVAHNLYFTLLYPL
jgi:hypothetical protein